MWCSCLSRNLKIYCECVQSKWDCKLCLSDLLLHTILAVHSSPLSCYYPLNISCSENNSRRTMVKCWVIKVIVFGCLQQICGQFLLPSYGSLTICSKTMWICQGMLGHSWVDILCFYLMFASTLLLFTHGENIETDPMEVDNKLLFENIANNDLSNTRIILFQKV